MKQPLETLCMAIQISHTDSMVHKIPITCLYFTYYITAGTRQLTPEKEAVIKEGNNVTFNFRIDPQVIAILKE